MPKLKTKKIERKTRQKKLFNVMKKKKRKCHKATKTTQRTSYLN